jgi:hypothetical protein
MIPLDVFRLWWDSAPLYTDHSGTEGETQADQGLAEKGWRSGQSYRNPTGSRGYRKRVEVQGVIHRNPTGSTGYRI